MQRIGDFPFGPFAGVDAGEVGFDHVVAGREVEGEGRSLGNDGIPDHLAERFAMLRGISQTDPHGFRRVGEVPREAVGRGADTPMFAEVGVDHLHGERFREERPVRGGVRERER